jgi:hypothetical protein
VSKITLLRSDVTAEEVSAVLRRELGSRYTVTRGSRGQDLAGDDRGADRRQPEASLRVGGARDRQGAGDRHHRLAPGVYRSTFLDAAA